MTKHPKGLLKGNKVGGTHTTIIDGARAIFAEAKKLHEVTKIIPGIITKVKSNNTHIKFTPIDAGFKLQVKSVKAVQIFYIYTSNPERTQKMLEDFWNVDSR